MPTTGSPQAIASTSTFGIPSRSPESATRHGRQNAEARRYSSKSCACVIEPSEADAAVEPELRDGALELRAHLRLERRPVADDHAPRPERRGRPARATASTRTSKPFFATSLPDGEDAEAPVPGGDATAVGEDAGEVDVQPVVDAVHVRARPPSAPEMAPVRLACT